MYIGRACTPSSSVALAPSAFHTSAPSVARDFADRAENLRIDRSTRYDIMCSGAVMPLNSLDFLACRIMCFIPWVTHGYHKCSKMPIGRMLLLPSRYARHTAQSPARRDGGEAEDDVNQSDIIGCLN
jgi:hypothetical protein